MQKKNYHAKNSRKFIFLVYHCYIIVGILATDDNQLQFGTYLRMKW